MKLNSLRRTMLDALLIENQNVFKGRVIDVGGKKVNARGLQIPHPKDVTCWESLNIDKNTNPDYLCSAENIPVNSESFDVAVMCEVLEHLENPEKVLDEITRVLKNHGKIVLSVPFLWGYHADPYDFQRWTQVKIKMVLTERGFSTIDIQPMGGIGSVIYDLFLIQLKKTRQLVVSKIGLRLLLVLKPILLFLDRVASFDKELVTTGFFVIATKNTQPDK